MFTARASRSVAAVRRAVSCSTATPSSALGSLPARSERPKVEVGGVEQVQFGSGKCPRLEHGRRIGAVLLEQAVQLVAPALEFREPCRVVLHFPRIVGRKARKFVEVGERGVEQFAPRRDGGIGPLERGERAIGLPQRGEGTLIAGAGGLADARRMPAQRPGL